MSADIRILLAKSESLKVISEVLKQRLEVQGQRLKTIYETNNAVVDAIRKDVSTLHHRPLTTL